MSKTILMVDDDLDYLEAMKALLESNGYRVVTESNGQRGFDAMRQQKPDLLLLDVMMPNSDGFDIARALHSDEELKKVPVIIVSGIRKEMRLPFSGRYRNVHHSGHRAEGVVDRHDLLIGDIFFVGFDIALIGAG